MSSVQRECLTVRSPKATWGTNREPSALLVAVCCLLGLPEAVSVAWYKCSQNIDTKTFYKKILIGWQTSTSLTHLVHKGWQTELISEATRNTEPRFIAKQLRSSIKGRLDNDIFNPQTALLNSWDLHETAVIFPVLIVIRLTLPNSDIFKGKNRGRCTRRQESLLWVDPGR